MKIITCGILSWHLLYLALAPILYVLVCYFSFSIERPNKKPLTPLTFSSIISFCQFISGFGYLYYLCISKQNTSKDSIPRGTAAQFRVIKITKEKRFNHLFFFMIIGLSLITFLQNIILSTTNLRYSLLKVGDKALRSNLDFQLIGFAMFFIILLGYFVLSYSLYLHQVVSLGFITVGICFILFPNISQEPNLHIKIPMFLGDAILSSIRYIYEKWLMEKNFTTSHQLLFVEGLIALIMGLIAGYFFSLSEVLTNLLGSSLTLFIEIWECASNSVVSMVLGCLSCMLYNLFMMLTRYYYTPMHCCVANLLSSFIMWVLLISQKMTIQDNQWATIIGFLLLLFGELLYNEIIICYLFKLHYFTGKEITLRSELEFESNFERSSMTELTI